MPVTLESRARRMQVFHLPHEVFCRDRCACGDVVVSVVAENPRTGERARKRVVKPVPGSITFLARERKADLPAALIELAQVKAAIHRGDLRIIAQAPDVSAPAESSTAATTPGPVASPAPGQPTAITAQVHASPAPAPAPGPAGQQLASAPPATGPAPVPVPPSTSSPSPAPSLVPAGSPAYSAAPAPATKPPGKEA